MDQCIITEVGLRDGLQNEPNFLATEKKSDIANRVIAAGVSRIEATSFVSPKAVPQLADAEDMIAGINRKDDLIIEALAPNKRGGLRAASANVDVWVAFLSASEKHSLANSNASIADAFERIVPMVQLAEDQNASITAAIAVAFDCPFEGATPVERVVKIAQNFFEIGVRTLKLGDTIGTASPSRVRALVSALTRELPEMELVLHFHNTRGLGLSNVLVGLECGVSRYEASLGGLGGCPFAPGASGNIATEDLVHLLHLEGVKTGIDLDALINAGAVFSEYLGRKLPAHLQSARPVGVTYDFDSALRATG